MASSRKRDKEKEDSDFDPQENMSAYPRDIYRRVEQLEEVVQHHLQIIEKIEKDLAEAKRQKNAREAGWCICGGGYICNYCLENN